MAARANRRAGVAFSLWTWLGCPLIGVLLAIGFGGRVSSWAGAMLLSIIPGVLVLCSAAITGRSIARAVPVGVAACALGLAGWGVLTLMLFNSGVLDT